MTLKMAELFAGYGGLGMGVAQVLDVDLAWVSEFDKGPSKILAHRFPGVPNHGDITKIDWATVEPVDILTGGFPCQDVSAAGKRAGIRPGTRSGLWSQFAFAISQLKPRLVVIENVRGLLSARAHSDVEPCAWCVGEDTGGALRALGAVLGDLAGLGFDAEWVGLPASRVGAPHGRWREFIAAYPKGDAGWLLDRDGDPAGHAGRIGGHEALEHDGRGAPAGDRRGVPDQPDRDALRAGPDGGVTLLPTPVADNSRGLPSSGTDFQSLPNAVCALLLTPAVNDMGAAYTPEQWDAWTERMKAEHGNGNGHGKSLNIEAQRLLPTPRAQDSDESIETFRARTGELQERGDRNGGPTGMPLGVAVQAWGDYAAAIARWEHILGRPAPAPTQTSAKGNPQLSARFTEWMMGLPDGWITDVPGITRNEALKACGNGVVPQQAAAALRWMLARVGGVAA